MTFLEKWGDRARICGDYIERHKALAVHACLVNDWPGARFEVEEAENWQRELKKAKRLFSKNKKALVAGAS